MPLGVKVRLTAAAITYRDTYDRYILRGDTNGKFTQALARFGAAGMTGTVQKVFKNGQVAVAADYYRNTSEDGRKTVHASAAWLEVIS